MADTDFEQRVRATCFVSIGHMQHVHGDVLPVEVIQAGVTVDGERITMFSPQKGIHTPRQPGRGAGGHHSTAAIDQARMHG